MKTFLYSIKQDKDSYIYEYHHKDSKSFKTFGLLSIAGLIGSFQVVNENGWLYLFPFWIIIFIISKIFNWIIEKIDNSKFVCLRFISKYPHYNFNDILWMLKYTDQSVQLGDEISSASDDWGKEIDIDIGKLSTMQISNTSYSHEKLRKIVDEQMELQDKWSLNTGLKYPDLGMPKR